MGKKKSAELRIAAPQRTDASSTPFVGRSKELARLQDALEHAIAGEGRMAMLAGEPGIGKTRTAEELTRTAVKRGACVLWGGCYEGEGAPLYWPWTQVLRELASAHSPKELAGLLGPRASVIAATFPLLAEILPDLPPPPPMDDPISARFRLFDAFSAFLKDASRGAPLLVVLDDLHWADTASLLLLLEFLAHQIRSARLLVLGTYRDVELGRMHPLQRTLGDLTRQRLFERVTLRGLGVEEVREYLEGTAGAGTRQELAGEVYERTEGNPLFVTEVVRLLGEEGELKGGRPAGPMIRVPEGIKETIGRRMDRLSPKCSEALRAAALLGRQFSLETLSRVIEVNSPDALLNAIESAVEARIVEEAPGRPGFYRFTHALTQQTLAEEVPLARQVRLHARIVEALEEQYGERGRWEHAEELAEHCAKAEPVLGTGKLAGYLMAAGQAALGRYANEEARELFSRALEVKGEAPVDEEGADILYGLGRIQLALLEDKGIESLSKAFTYYADAGCRKKAVAVAVDPAVWVLEIRQDLHPEISRRAMDFVELGTVAEAEVLAKHAVSEYFIDANYAASCERLERSLEIARRVGSTATEMRIWVYWAFVDSHEYRFQDALEKAEKAYRLAEGIDDLHALVMVLSFRIRARTNWGASVAEKEQDVERLVQLAERLKDRGWLARSYYQKAILAGDDAGIDEALRLNDVVLGYQPDFCYAINQRAGLILSRGDFEEGERTFRRAIACVQSRHQDPFLQAQAAGWITGSAFLYEKKWPDLLALAERWSQDILRNPSAPRSASILAEVSTWYLALIRGDTKAAAGYCGRALEVFGGGRWRIPTTSLGVLPLLERAAGRIEDAIAHLRIGVEECRMQGMPGGEAWWGLYLGQTLLETGERDDFDEAIQTLRRSLELAQSRGILFVEQRARAALDAAEKAAARGVPAKGTASQEAAASARPALPDGLTEREADVLRLLTRGKTNKEIGFELFISPKTVDTHVQSILRKTGAANRAEAAAYAVRKGLAEG